MLKLIKTKVLKGELKPTKQKRKLGGQYQMKVSENRAVKHVRFTSNFVD
jgi:hypothetical protein